MKVSDRTTTEADSCSSRAEILVRSSLSGGSARCSEKRLRDRARVGVLALLLGAAAAAATGEELAPADLDEADRGPTDRGPTGQKFHPGHYVALSMNDDGPEAMRDALRPGVQGLQMRYAWRDLEVSEGVYDLSSIASDLATVRAEGRQLVAFVFDKSFRDERFTPEYLWERHTLPVRSAEPGKGWVSKRWDPWVVERMGRLLDEIGRQFDGDPHFEGVAIQESAIGVVDPVLDREGYTPTAYRDALVATLRRACDALPKSQVFWYLNYLARGQTLLPSVLAQLGDCEVVVGGPDVLPDSVPLRRHVYPLLQQAQPHWTLFTSAQYDSFRHERASTQAGASSAAGPTVYWTPEEIFAFARDELGVRYLFWNRVTFANPAGSFDIHDAYPVIAAHPRFNDGDARAP